MLHDLISAVPLPAWVIVVIVALLVAGRLAEAVHEIVDMLKRFIRAVRGLPFVRRRPGAETRRATGRREFAREVVRGLRNLEVKEQWSDSQFAELEARVETERRARLESPALRFFTFGRELRLRRSLTRALRTSTEPLLLLQGNPGSGKSVALRHVALQIGDKAAKSRRVNSLIPIYINLKGLRRASAEIGPRAIEEYVDDQLRKGATITVERFLDREFQPSVEEGTFFFLFDSFDEIPDILSSSEFDEAVAAYSQAIAAFLRGMRNCRGVVASREFRAPEGLQWPAWRIVPLDERRRRRLVHRALLDREAEGILLAGLRAADSDLAKLSSNPMFLNLLCAFVERRKAFPANTHEVVEEYVVQRFALDEDRLVEKFAIDSNDLRSVAEAAAFCMAAEPGLGLEPTRGEILEAIVKRKFCESEVAYAGLQALEWVKLAQGKDVGPESTDRLFTFSHRRFQEYFATCAVLTKRGSVSEEELLTDWRWRETAVTLLQLQRDEAASLIEQAAKLLRAAAGEDSLDPQQVAGIATGEFALAMPTIVAWPAHIPHVLDILQSGTGGNPGELPEALRRDATIIVARAFANGDTADQKRALDVAGVVIREVVTGMLRAAFRSRSDWLHETAYKQTARLDLVPNDVQSAICRMLVSMAATGSLWRDRLTARAQLSRLRSRNLMRAFNLMLLAPNIDIAAHVVALTLVMASATEVNATAAVWLTISAAVSFGSWRWAMSGVGRGPSFGWYGAIVSRLILSLWVTRLLKPHDPAGIAGVVGLIYSLWWSPSACFAVVCGRLMHPAWWPMLPLVGARAALERLKALSLEARVWSAAGVVFFIVYWFWGERQVYRLIPVGWLIAGCAVLLTPLWLYSLKYWVYAIVHDVRWYRSWRRNVPDLLSARELLECLGEQQSPHGARRLMLDLRLEERVETSEQSLDVLTDLGLATKSVITRQGVATSRWRSEIFPAWLEDPDAVRVLRVTADAIDDDVAQLRESMGIEVARRVGRARNSESRDAYAPDAAAGV